MNSIRLQENKWEDVAEYLKSKKTILIPFGSTEQHGKHLPLGTDSLVANKVAEEVGEKTNTLVAPPNWLGWAPHHMAYPGTITLRPETLVSLAMDICQSLIYHGFEKLILVNGHREANLPPLKIAATKLRNQTGAFIAIADPFYIAYEIGKEIKVSEPGGVGHAAEMETSHMYYIHPELCIKENAVKNIKMKHPYLSHDPFVKGDTVFVPSDISAYKEVTNYIGVVGDPTVSTKENGRIYHEQLVQNLISFVEFCDKEIEVSLRNQEIPI